MKMLRPISEDAKVLTGCVGVALFQIVWHAILLLDYDMMRSMLAFYLAYNPLNQKTHAGWFDLTLPGMAMGFVIGRIGWQWPILKSMAYVVSCGIGLVLLEPVYFHILKLDQMPWEPLLLPDFESRLRQQVVFTVLTVAIFSYAGQQMIVEADGASREKA